MTQIHQKFFGKLKDGREAFLYTITNANGTSAAFTNYGATTVSVTVPDRQGNFEDVVLGYGSVEEYEMHDRCAGATCGRFAGRIEGGGFTLDGIRYELSKNERQENTLHGGFEGFDRKLWDSRIEGDQVVFSYLSPDGEEGFPGTLHMQVICSLTDENEVVLRYHGISDKDTAVNLTNHIYFNLAGHGSGDIGRHQVKLLADFYLPSNAPISRPDGQILSVAGTPMDVREWTYIDDLWNGGYPEIDNLGGMNHPYIVNRQTRDGLAAGGAVWDEVSGRMVEISTTKPIVHFFTANNMTRRTGKDGAVYDVHGSFCLEPVYYGNSMKFRHFPSPFLKAGEAYCHETRYRFSCR